MDAAFVRKAPSSRVAIRQGECGIHSIALCAAWGYDTQIEAFHVLFPTPKTRIVEMTVTRAIYRMKLQNRRSPGDSTSESAELNNCRPTTPIPSMAT